MPVKDIYYRDNITDPSYYNWKSKYSDMQASGLKRLKQIKQELYQLKHMYANIVLKTGR